MGRVRVNALGAYSLRLAVDSPQWRSTDGSTVTAPPRAEMCRQAFSNLLSGSAIGLGAEAIIEQALSSLG